MKQTCTNALPASHFRFPVVSFRIAVGMVGFLFLLTGCAAEPTAVAAVRSTATEEVGVVAATATPTATVTATATLAPTETSVPTATSTPEAKCKLPEQTALKEKYKAQVYFNMEDGFGPTFDGRFPDEYLWGTSGITTGEIRDTNVSGLGTFTQTHVLSWGPDEQFVKYWTTIWFEPEEGSDLKEVHFYKTAMDGIHKKYFATRQDVLSHYEGEQLAVVISIASGNYLSKDGVDWATCVPGNGKLAISKDECKVGQLLYQESGDPITQFVLKGQSVPDEQFVFGWHTKLMFDPLPFDGEMVAACVAETE